MFAGAWAVQQLWLFWVAPLAGAVLAGVVYPQLAGEAAPKAAESSDDEILMGEPESVPVAPRAAAPRRAAAKTAYIELSDDDDDDYGWSDDDN